MKSGNDKKLRRVHQHNDILITLMLQQYAKLLAQPMKAQGIILEGTLCPDKLHKFPN